MCLTWLQAAPAGQRIVDYGCGSGILAIAACLYGAHSVVCFLNRQDESTYRCKHTTMRIVHTQLALGHQAEPVQTIDHVFIVTHIGQECVGRS